MILFPSCLFLFLLARIFQHHPPQEINYFIGFRTKKSMRNQKNWDKAQVAFARQLKVMSRYSALYSILLCIADIVFIVLNNDALLVTSLMIQSIILVGILLAVYLNVNKKLGA